MSWVQNSGLLKTTVAMLGVVFFLFCAGDVPAQKKFSRTYPAGQSVRLKLVNRTGTVTIEGWSKAEVSIQASMEAPTANIQPQSLSGEIVVNLVRDNQGRGEVGIVNFLIRVPYYTMVDIETMVGNLTVSNISGGLVRAHISTEGDITLLNIGASNVAADNVTGDIFFDGELQEGGNYRFSSNKGNIGLRIPFNSSFKVVATAPSTRDISFYQCAGPDLSLLGDGRRMVGKCGSGSATLSVTNQRGSIKFYRR
ncbi:MAG TPA: DUF4097 family beta strand repeat-containing protein [Pyrinomonadaceae bacterium]|jgi:hypothetical protein|nr:DUF4097 family beta strand repeat-containing protein [Pyrinomonadaceae bacterium]